MASVETEPATVDDTGYEDLRARFRGALLRPGEEGYDQARRVWNGAIDRRPAVIARCAGADDVVEAVRFARELDLLVSVRGGGHAVAGHAVCDGGLMIDLSLMKAVGVDPEARTVRASGGVLWGELDRATQRFGLATTGGMISHTGIAGLTLGGGLGNLMRKLGLTVDSLRSVDLVTAEGKRLHVSEETDAELFWGLRGGGGNFGIATSFEYRLHRIGPRVLGGPMLWPLTDAPAVLRVLRDFSADAPDDLGIALFTRLAPPMPFIPADQYAKPVLMLLPVRSQALDVGPIVLRAPAAPAGDVTDAYAVRRTVLDKMLVDAAAEAGAEVRERFSVDEVLDDGERVTGFRGRAAGGAAVTERARIVIGADGMNSLVARSVAAATYDEHPSLTCAYYGYWSGVEMQGAELYARPGQMIIGAPTNDGQVFVIVYWPNADFHSVRARIENNFMRALELAPGLAERVRSGRRTERFRGTGTLPNFYRRPYGAGWALVGDAGYHKDPITALGMSDAFRDAELLTDAVDAGLSAREPLERALADYERRRNKASAETYQTTIRFAGLKPPPPEMQRLFEALRDNPQETARFFGTVTGTVSAGEFFAPENVARIIGNAAVATV